MRNKYLVIEELDKRFGDLHVLDHLHLEVAEGEVLALLGPSGSGKTTCLRLLAGFEMPDGGRIVVAGDEVSRLPPARRGFGMVFQHYALFPHLSVGANVAFGLETRGWDRSRIEGRVAEMLALVDLAGFQERRLTQISGGQQQRVALARALAPEPRLLLLDEPLSNLDPALRERTRRQLRETIERVGISTVLVTHEQEEAFHLGDRVAVLHGGRLHQVGPPEELYAAPSTRFVATFVGRSSVLPGRLTRLGDGQLTVELATGLSWSLPVASLGGRPVPVGAAVEVVVRPEALAFTETSQGLGGQVVDRRYAGPVTFYQVAAAKLELEVQADAAAARPGQQVAVALRSAGPVPRVFPLEGPGEPR